MLLTPVVCLQVPKDCVAGPSLFVVWTLGPPIPTTECQLPVVLHCAQEISLALHHYLAVLLRVTYPNLEAVERVTLGALEIP